MKTMYEWFRHNVGSEVTVRILVPGRTTDETACTEKGVVTEVGADFFSLRREDRTEVLIPLHAIASWSPSS